MALRFISASYGRNISDINACIIGRSVDRTVIFKCNNQSLCLGFFTSEISENSRVGNNMIVSNSKVQNQTIPVANNHPITNKINNDGATRLRRRLSSSFHFDNRDKGFLRHGVKLSSIRFEHKTLGNNQPTNCQSPRIQR